VHDERLDAVYRNERGRCCLRVVYDQWHQLEPFCVQARPMDGRWFVEAGAVGAFSHRSW